MDGSGRMALVHEWIQDRSGSEQTFEALARAFPQADLYALSRQPGVDLDVGGRDVRTTWLDRPGLRNRRELTLPLMPLAWRGLGTPGYETVLSSHHAFASSNRLVAPGGTHLCYVHSPARYIWTPDIDERGQGRLRRVAAAALKAVDRAAARRVTAFAANSSEVASRIRAYWQRDALVIPPPVDVDYFSIVSEVAATRDYVLGVGRWIPYKNMHVVIEVAAELGMPAKIAGRGPERGRLEAAAEAVDVPVDIIEFPSDAELRELYRNAVALVFPTFEDFGLVPIEAQAAGTPVVALGRGGVLDTVVPGRTGILTDGLSARELAEGVTAAMGLLPGDCRANADRFSVQAFIDAIRGWVSATTATEQP